ncbi:MULTISPECIES: ParB/RepB/Spo0J family partition protein [unclassified Actinomyces]|uniref:ParB/RepB/Spo0J family partition protein n=1 Tax=unclassified Actinomyces TaxID=2609248 RepID=UPI0020181616|nr:MULTISPECIES: ParB/RepB/Spo0J family partition protein [unclassified Actinomyces]MCL3778554.1 ParB/RepB/Spo0J family partition protein [Actinomyces sp. AC-20-1]MCL3789507.1 ParB/RepB/Spo0J family partition protein [Actinomyces sp. 187325]MCL3791836.1 ParB/RepB/Spo0J family partition protein [Actinomyces sp. 186855]MCL3793515.1 ParB/RepB/Spo0J family partition protein [Actinomyces sp. 217892]
MAQKKRGLGRGLQALIPEAQTENPSSRPTDVFFPGSGRGAEVERGSEGSSRAAEIAEVLMEPSKRARSGTRRSGRSAETHVSRETPVGDGLGHSSDRRVSPGTSAEDVPRDEGVAPVSRETSATDPVEPSTTGDDQGLVPVPGATFAELPVELIVPNPRQPRQVFDDDDIAELAASIEEVGLLQPVVVRRVDGEDGSTTYELIMGERRLRASKVAGLNVIPAVVRYTEDEDLLRDALLENLHRVQLNPLEEAAAYQQLLEDFSCTHAELSQRIARSRSQVSNTLRLLKLPALVQRRVAAGVLSAGHARALLGLPDASAMERLAQKIVAEGLSVRAVEELVALHDEPEIRTPVMRTRSTTLPALSTRLSDAFDTRVKVTRGAKKGKITIEFAGDEDLARLIEALAPGTSLSED